MSYADKIIDTILKLKIASLRKLLQNTSQKLII